MMDLVLIRVGQSPVGTFGVLRHGQVPFALTLEPPWMDNQNSASCIPPGRYTCQSIRSPKFGTTYEIINVPGRTHVLFHSGNYVDDTEGCVLVGEEFGGTFDKPMLMISRRGFSEFMALVSGHSTFEIEIIDASISAAIKDVTATQV